MSRRRARVALSPWLTARKLGGRIATRCHPPSRSPRDGNSPVAVATSRFRSLHPTEWNRDRTESGEILDLSRLILPPWTRPHASPERQIPVGEGGIMNVWTPRPQTTPDPNAIRLTLPPAWKRTIERVTAQLRVPRWLWAKASPMQQGRSPGSTGSLRVFPVRNSGQAINSRPWIAGLAGWGVLGLFSRLALGWGNSQMWLRKAYESFPAAFQRLLLTMGWPGRRTGCWRTQEILSREVELIASPPERRWSLAWSSSATMALNKRFDHNSNSISRRRRLVALRLLLRSVDISPRPLRQLNPGSVSSAVMRTMPRLLWFSAASKIDSETRRMGLSMSRCFHQGVYNIRFRQLSSTLFSCRGEAGSV